MSLGMIIKAPEGIVLAAESRITLGAGQPPIPVHFDNATKLYGFEEPHKSVGVVTYGQAIIGMRTAHSFLPEFEASLPNKRTSIEDFAKHLSAFFMKQWKNVMPKKWDGPDMTFLVGGLNKDAPYGTVYQVDIPRNLTPHLHHPNPLDFGITWGGQRDFVDRILQGFDSSLPGRLIQELKLDKGQQAALQGILGNLPMKIPLQALPLQDCIDLAIFFIRTTIYAQQLTIGIRGCGGFIDIAIIRRREGFEYIQRKTLKGEPDHSRVMEVLS